MKHIRKITIISLLTVFFVAILMSIYIMLVQADKAFAFQVEMQAYRISQQYDEELKNLTHTPTVDEDFDDDEITIILDCKHSGTELKNSVYNFDEVVAELGKIDNIDINSIEELFCTEENENVSTTYRRMLSLKIKTPGKLNVIATIEQLNKLDMVLSAEPQYNYTCAKEWVPSDTDYSKQWGLNGEYGINAETAWDISKGSGVKVGLFETGIDANHEDLKDRVGQGNFTPAADADLSHGTHVGGIISAVSNDRGIAGISQATLHLLNMDNFESSLSFAADNEIKIINASFTYIVSSTDDSPAPANSAHRQAIENYGMKGGLLICSAGNDSANTDNSPHYPSGYGDSSFFPNVYNVISVGSIERDGKRSWFSNYGTNSVHIYAPGGSIYSTLPGDSYGDKSGTSMAAPHVTGVAALIMSKAPTFTVDELKETIFRGADDITISTPSGLQNVKRLNAGKALELFEQDYTVTLVSDGNTTEKNVITVKYGEQLPELFAPKKDGYAFNAYYDKYGTMYYEMELKNDPQTAQINGLDFAYVEKAVPVDGMVWDKIEDATLYARWSTTPFECDYTYYAYCDSEYIGGGGAHLTHGASTIKPVDINGYNFSHFTYGGVSYSADDNIPVILYRGLSGRPCLYGVISAYYEKACVAEGSMITLAGGEQVAVENLTGNETLLVWNLYTGTYDTAPILFIDSDPLQLYKVINLLFSDGTKVKVISEHGFWDYDLNKYVSLDENAEEYIGHWFNKGDIKVQLTGVEVKEEYTTPYSPVTYGHLCYFVDGMLSMPGGIDGLFNIFDVDAETMRYDEASMQLDIETYGLFTYEEFIEYLDVSEEVFEAFNGQYLKVAIGKGLTDMDKLASLVERYQEFF